MVAPLEVTHIDNVTEAIPAQEELDKYVGKTGSDLLDEGWSWSYYDLEEMKVGMTHGWFSYDVVFEGKIENKEDLDIEEAIKDLKVLSVSYAGLGDLTDIETE